MIDPQTDDMIARLSAQLVRMVQANERLVAEVNRLKRQVDALNEALAHKPAGVPFPICPSIPPPPWDVTCLRGGEPK